MITLIQELAERARVPADREKIDYLRALTLTNAAAAMGSLGGYETLAERLPIDPGSPPGAAFVHAVHLHARTQDDFHPSGRVHVGAVALAATLALADVVHDRFFESLVAGYETMCTIACVYSRDAQQRGYRPTGMFGAFGAAASAAVALRLDYETTATAIGLAAARSGGTNQSWLSGTDEWLLEVGYAARSGVEAALLAQAGVRAAPDALEGAAGWARAFFGDDGASRLADSMATPASRVREVAQKPYPVSGIAQPATRLACEAHAAGVGYPSAVELRMSEAEAAYPGSANSGPFRSRSDALMSVAFCVACGLTDGTVRLARLDAPYELEDAASRIEIVPDATLAEGTAVIALDSGAGGYEATASAAQILFAGWTDESLGAAPLARRSEAAEDAVAALRLALEPERVDATALAALLRRHA